jgi:hypothetical protein
MARAGSRLLYVTVIMRMFAESIPKVCAFIVSMIKALACLEIVVCSVMFSKEHCHKWLIRLFFSMQAQNQNFLLDLFLCSLWCRCQGLIGFDSLDASITICSTNAPCVSLCLTSTPRGIEKQALGRPSGFTDLNPNTLLILFDQLAFLLRFWYRIAFLV